MKNTDFYAGFEARYNREIVPYYLDRDDRNRWAASIVKNFPGSNVLNLGGGGKRHLGNHLGPNWSVHEIDVGGDCDTTMNLDTIDRLPFADGYFDTSCAFEVLEHLEHFHLILDEMYRVSRSIIFISLPNAAVAMLSILRNLKIYDDPRQNGVYTKYYGLPLVVPGDRHRWWLTFDDIVRFFIDFEERNACTIEFYVPVPDPTIKRKLFRMLTGDRIFMNLVCTNVWIKICKS